MAGDVAGRAGGDKPEVLPAFGAGAVREAAGAFRPEAAAASGLEEEDGAGAVGRMRRSY